MLSERVLKYRVNKNYCTRVCVCVCMFVSVYAHMCRRTYLGCKSEKCTFKKDAIVPSICARYVRNRCIDIQDVSDTYYITVNDRLSRSF